MREFARLNDPFKTMSASVAVDMASTVAADFTSHCRGQYVIAAQRAGLDRDAFKRLLQPSRKPKTISVDFWHRLVSGYTAHLRRELHRIEAEIERLDRIGSPVAPLEDLMDQVDGVADRLRHILEKRG